MRVKIKKVSDPTREHLVGHEFDVVARKTHEGVPYVFVEYEGKQLALPRDFYDIIGECEHSWIEGFINTWCRFCDAEGHYDNGNLKITKHTSSTLDKDKE